MTRRADFPITRRWPPVDPARIVLHSFPTPDGVTPSIALEDLCLPHEAHRVTLGDADVNAAEFLSLTPDTKIPALIDPDGQDRRAGACSIAGIALTPWLRGLPFHGAKDVVGWHALPRMQACLARFLARPAVQAGLVTPPRAG